MVNTDKAATDAAAAEADEPHGDPEAVPMVAIADPKETSGKSLSDDHQHQKDKTALAGLSKEELQAYINDPFWHRLRLASLIIFCLVWVCLFAAVLTIVIASPKCPPRPTRQFWQSPIYRLQLAAFAPAGDTNPEAVGSVDGLTRRLSHIRETLGISNFLLGGGLHPVGPSGCPIDFTALRPALGTLASLRSLTKAGRKKGFNLMLELDLTQADPAWVEAADIDGVFAKAPDGSGTPLRSRDGRPGKLGGRLHLPRGACDSLNVTSPAALNRLDFAMTAWLEAGVSGFLLNNVAFLLPSALTLDGLPARTDPSSAGLTPDDWFHRDPSPVLYSNASVGFVRWARKLLDREASRLGRDLALFVDPGNTGFPQPAERLAAYLDKVDGAHAIVCVGLGRPLSARAPTSPATSASQASQVESVLAAAGQRGSVIFATAWPSLRRPSDPTMTALSLTLPGVPCLYYGQELGMAHVPGIRFRGNASLPSYLSGDDSTDASETPMQWEGGAANAGWLSNVSLPLAWANLTLRADDIVAHNLRRLGASGHPQSALQFARQLLRLSTELESLQWGDIEFLTTAAVGSGLLAFRRQAVRFPAVLLVANSANVPATVDLTSGKGGGVGGSGSLRLMHTGVGGDRASASEYLVGKSYPLDRVFVPGLTTLIFQAD